LASYSILRRESLIVYGLLAAYLLLSFSWQGLFFSDDVVYMETGQLVHLSSFIRNISIAPLYALWFKSIGYFVRDAIARYFVSWVLLVVSIASIPLWFRIRCAWLYTLIIVCCPIFSVSPYVSLFAGIFILAGVCFIIRRQVGLDVALSLACLVCFIVSFARPEYAYGVFFSAIATATGLFIERSRHTFRRIATKLTVVACLCAASAFTATHSTNPGYGIAPQGTSRSGMAFAQHVNVRAAKKGLLGGESPWHSTYALKIFRIDLAHNAGNTQATIGDFFHASPRLFIAHLIANLLDARTIALFVLVIMIAMWPWVFARCRHLRPSCAFAALVSIPILISTVLIYPRPHYPILVFPAFLVLAVQITLAYRSIKTPSAIWTLLIGLCVILISAISYKQSHKAEVALGKSNLLLINCLRGMEISAGVGNGLVFDTVDINSVFLHERRTFVTDVDIQTSSLFRSWLDKARPGWVVITPDAASKYHVNQAWMNNSLLILDYTPRPCPGKNDATVYTLSK
jgi:hypothetical protein